jgi:mannose-6-phosphate isomerase-like protein (cupin superfamily)
VLRRRRATAEIEAPQDDLVMRKLLTADDGAGMSITWVRLSGHHRRLRTERSTRVYYILDGVATFVVGDEPAFDAQEGDVVVVSRGTPYEFEGEATYLVLNTPAFVDGDDVYDE